MRGIECNNEVSCDIILPASSQSHVIVCPPSTAKPLVKLNVTSRPLRNSLMTVEVGTVRVGANSKNRRGEGEEREVEDHARVAKIRKVAVSECG